MARYEFQIVEVPVPGTATHTWAAIEKATGAQIDLPQGGTGHHVGSYPEIEQYLLQTHGLKHALKHHGGLDSLRTDYGNGDFVWTFNRAPNVIVVHDIPRTVVRVTSGP